MLSAEGPKHTHAFKKKEETKTSFFSAELFHLAYLYLHLIASISGYRFVKEIINNID